MGRQERSLGHERNGAGQSSRLVRPGSPESHQPLLADKPALRQALAALRTWNSDYYAALYAYNGGGTLYLHCGSRSVASLADLEAQAARDWSAKPKAVKLEQAKSFAEFHKPNTDLPDPAEYKRAAAKEAASLAKAQAAIRALPPGAALVLSKYIVELARTNWGED